MHLRIISQVAACLVGVRPFTFHARQDGWHVCVCGLVCVRDCVYVRVSRTGCELCLRCAEDTVSLLRCGGVQDSLHTLENLHEHRHTRTHTQKRHTVCNQHAATSMCIAALSRTRYDSLRLVLRVRICVCM